MEMKSSRRNFLGVALSFVSGIRPLLDTPPLPEVKTTTIVYHQYVLSWISPHAGPRGIPRGLGVENVAPVPPLSCEKSL